MLKTRRIVPAAAVAALVTIPRLLTIPRGFWSAEEVRFAQAVVSFEPLHQRPEAPGYPLYVAIARAATFFCPSPFVGMLMLSVVATFAGAMMLVLASRNHAASAWLGAASDRTDAVSAGDRSILTGAIAVVLLYLSPAMLIFVGLPNEQAVTGAFVAAAFLALSRGHAVGLAIATAAAVGCMPQLAPAAIVMFLLGVRDMPRRLVACAVFVVATALAFVPLLDEIGFARVRPYANAAFAAARRASEAADVHGLAAVMRFAVHPWGSKMLSLLMLVLIAIGAFRLWRSRAVQLIPIAAFGVVDVAVCLLFADRSNGVEPVLPALASFAVIAAAAFEIDSGAPQRRFLSRRSLPIAGAVVAFIYAIGSILYVFPILRERSTMLSPPVAAALAVCDLSRGGVLLYDSELEPFAQEISRGAQLADATLEDEFVNVPRVVLLADRPSNVPGARTFAWPASDAYGKLTTKRFRIVSAAELPMQRRYFALSGVYPPEHDVDGREWRWLAKDASIRLPPANAHSVRVELGLALFAPFESNDVELFVNGTRVARVHVTKGKTTAVAVPLTGVTNELSFRATAAFTPAATDNRQLSVQLFGVAQL